MADLNLMILNLQGCSKMLMSVLEIMLLAFITGCASSLDLYK
jgi:hypothetical protein